MSHREVLQSTPLSLSLIPWISYRLPVEQRQTQIKTIAVAVKT